jgi:hypothetical protein
MGPQGPSGNQLWASFVPAFAAAYTAAAMTPDYNIVVTRLQAQLAVGPSRCATNATMQITDGVTTYSLTLTNSANDSGPLRLNFAAGTRISLNATAAVCSSGVAPALGNVVVQYKVR